MTLPQEQSLKLFEMSSTTKESPFGPETAGGPGQPRPSKITADSSRHPAPQVPRVGAQGRVLSNGGG